MTLTCSQFETVTAALAYYALSAANPEPALAVLRSLDQTGAARIVERVLAERATRAELVALAVTPITIREGMPV